MLAFEAIGRRHGTSLHALPHSVIQRGVSFVSVEFIGMIQQQKVSETHLARGPAIDIDYTRNFAQAHEKAGFDRILVPYQSTSPEALLTVAYAAGGAKRAQLRLRRP